MKVNSINSILGNRNILSNKKAQKNQNNKNINQTNKTNAINNSHPIFFSRRWREHASWGAVVNPNTKDVTFKLFTFPDVESVNTIVEKKDNNETLIIPLKNKGNGIFETDKPIPSSLIQENDKYYYEIKRKDGTTIKANDPYSIELSTDDTKSIIYDHSKYQWRDENWYKNNPKRISRLANSQNNLTKLNDARIYEINIATFTQGGDFNSAAKKLDKIAKKGYNAIHIMPVEETLEYFNWGYDGRYKTAVAQNLGGADNFKKFVDLAHNKNLNVIIDMVPNHLGPFDQNLRETGPYIKGGNVFGDAWNFEGQNSTYVRDFMVNSALNWLKNYHCDGIRFDMTKYMDSDVTMKQIAAEINYHFPDAFLIAEDSRSSVASNGEHRWDDYSKKHDERVLQQLKPEENSPYMSEDEHNTVIEKMNPENGMTNLARLGYNTEWDFNYFHTLKNHLYGNCNLDELYNACLQGQSRLKYVMSHDEIGNHEGTRLIPKLMVPMLHLNENISLDTQDLNRAIKLAELKNLNIDQALNNVTLQKAQMASEKLVDLYVTGETEKYSDYDYEKFYQEKLEPIGIKKEAYIIPRRIKAMYKQAYDSYKMAQAFTYSQNGPKMTFQGDDEVTNTPFRFFRASKRAPYEPNLYIEKGYNSNEVKTSQLNDDNVKGNALEQKHGAIRLIKDLNKLADENSAMSNGQIIKENTVIHSGSKVIALHSKDNETQDEIYTIANFSDMKYPREDADRYYIKFPQGIWQEAINTDDFKYKGEGYINKQDIISDGQNPYPINLSNRSTLIFKKIR